MKQKNVLILISVIVFVFFMIGGVGIALAVQVGRNLQNRVDVDNETPEIVDVQQEAIIEELTSENGETEEEIASLDTTMDDPEMVEEPTSDPEPAPAPQPTIVAEQYTNQFFPGFELNYNSTWKFTTVTEPSYLDGIVNRTILLEKGGTTMTFKFMPAPAFGGGCGVPDRGPETPFVSFFNANGTYLSRYNAYEDGDYYARGDQENYYDCKPMTQFWIQSSIDVPEEEAQFYYDSKLSFLMSVTVKGAEHVFEADEIIKNSRF
jgi:cell division protein FtsB